MKETLNIDLRKVSLRQLRALVALSDCGTVSGAAGILHVTPPAVTMQIKQLEAAVGLPLTERAGERFRLTEAGREVVETARRVDMALRDCGESLARLHGLTGGRVSIGVVSTAKYFAPRMLAAFAIAHPEVEIQLCVGNRRDTLAGLRDHELDLAIMGRPPDDFEIDQAIIGDHPHVIIAPPEHPLAGRRDIGLGELASESFLIREQGSGTRALALRLFQGAGFAPRLGMEMSSNETIKQAVMAGLGVAVISAHTVAAELDYGRLVALDVVGLPVVRQWFVAKRTDKRLLPAARGLWDFLASEGARFLPETPVVVPVAAAPGSAERWPDRASAQLLAQE